MYLRPGNLLKHFVVERYTPTGKTGGRAVYEYQADGEISAVLAQAKPSEIERFRQDAHPITHTIIQRGRPKARPQDRLILEERQFYIQGVDEIGNLAICTIYYAEERRGQSHVANRNTGGGGTNRPEY